MSDITLGIIGSGQLGSLLCQAAKKLKVKTIVISDDDKGPAQNYVDEFIFSILALIFAFQKGAPSPFNAGMIKVSVNSL